MVGAVQPCWQGKKSNEAWLFASCSHGIGTWEQEPAMVGQLRRDEIVRDAVKFLDRTARPLAGEGIPPRAKIVWQGVARLQDIDEAEADEIDQQRPRLIKPGKKRARCHPANLERHPRKAQAPRSRTRESGDLLQETPRPYGRGYDFANLPLFFALFCG